jgi:uncharacterized protein
VLLNDLTECAFLRISTLPRLGLSTIPLTLQFWNQLQKYPYAERATPGSSHHLHCIHLITKLKLSGNDIKDVWLAALAMEHNATLVSTDEGFARFPKLNWVNPCSRI